MAINIEGRIRELVKELERGFTSEITGKIGIAINSHNRPDMARKCREEIVKRMPDNSILVMVDDASDELVENIDYRFSKNVGIARAKNKSLELLYKAGCYHFFLFDDDTYPVCDDWYVPYCKSEQPHLMYIFRNFANGVPAGDCEEVFRDSEIVSFSHPRGCMLYFKRECLDIVGGMDLDFNRWGWEHVDLSDRIFNTGLTLFPYMDVLRNHSGNRMFYSDDEHTVNANSTLSRQERFDQVAKNKEIYLSKKGSRKYMPFYERENIFLTCYFSGVPDPQRGSGWAVDPSALYKLYDSVSLNSGKLVVIHDCFDAMHLTEFTPDTVEFIYTETSLNPYFQRWVSYRDFLVKNRHYLDKVFCIDATDVEILNTPYWDEMGGALYVGDENTIVDNGWLRGNHTGPEIEPLFEDYGQRQLLNAGVIGGEVNLLIDFMRDILDFFLNLKNPSNHLTDMAVFNYVLREKYRGKIKSGREITTGFKQDERNNYTWIKHK